MPEIDFTAWPIWLIALLFALNLFKEPLARMFPVFFSFLTSRAKWEAEQRAIKDEAERQDDIAILSAMVQLQTETIKQNERLLDFILSRLNSRLTEMGETIKAELQSIRQELNDINNRWLAASVESNKAASQHQLTRAELVRLIDRFEAVEKKLIVFTNEAR
jgi:DNA anti-recombination protein RmuC